MSEYSIWHLHTRLVVPGANERGGATYSMYSIKICAMLPSNQHFYRQITSHKKGGAVSGVGQC